MKIALVVAASVVALMSGCATTSTTPTTSPVAAMDPYDNVDYAKVAAINNAAKSQGLLIKWINYPEKKKAMPGASPSRTDSST